MRTHGVINKGLLVFFVDLANNPIKPWHIRSEEVTQQHVTTSFAASLPSFSEINL